MVCRPCNHRIGLVEAGRIRDERIEAYILAFTTVPVMPNRIIRESCRSSPTLAQLSPEAERLFWRLTTVADDHGRFEADPMVVMADCFKAMLHKVTVGKVARWIAELRAAGLVSIYRVGEKTLGEFASWSKHQRMRKDRGSKYAPPTAATGGQVPPTAACSTEVQKYRSTEEGVRSSSNVVLSDDQFISTLRSNPAYEGIDLDRELGRMDAWLALPKNRARKKTRGFIVAWLNRIDRPVAPAPSGLMNPNNEAVARRFLQRHESDT